MAEDVGGIRATVELDDSDLDAKIARLRASIGQVEAQMQNLQREMQREYYGQYIREWTQLLSSIELRAVHPAGSWLLVVSAATRRHASTCLPVLREMSPRLGATAAARPTASC